MQERNIFIRCQDSETVGYKLNIKIDRRSTLNYKKEAEKIKRSLSKILPKNAIKNCANPELEEELFLWISNLESKIGFYTEKIIKEKALEISENLNIGKSKASNGRLEKFKGR